MSKQYRDLIKRQARIAELLERKRRYSEELKEDIKTLSEESHNIHVELLTMHLGGDDEDKDD